MTKVRPGLRRCTRCSGQAMFPNCCSTFQ
ncbi:hypothetical protein LINGRAHAP2_LOCUS27906 [Linum grandiflorum]